MPQEEPEGTSATTPDQVFFLAILDRHERVLKETREDFGKQIAALRGDFRIFGIILLLGILALAGVNVAFNTGALSFKASQASEP
jgi:hypothetical protein